MTKAERHRHNERCLQAYQKEQGKEGDALPEKNGRFLVVLANGGIGTMSYYKNQWLTGINKIDPTHWMPLPQPPKSQKE